MKYLHLNTMETFLSTQVAENTRKVCLNPKGLQTKTRDREVIQSITFSNSRLQLMQLQYSKLTTRCTKMY